MSFYSIPYVAVAKALRRAAEGKAAAQAEAAEWKRKYELERARNLHLEYKGCLFNNFYIHPFTYLVCAFECSIIVMDG